LQIKNQPQYFSALDGLRFFAFMVVFVCHIVQSKSNVDFPFFFNYIIHLFNYGYLAVDLFFLLSAFLITWWSFLEKQNFGVFNFKKYFIRRVLRIWPLYFLMIFFCQLIIFIQTYFGLEVSEIPSLLYHFTFTLNFACLKNDQFLMVILWSISVEEQYYIFSGVLHKFQKNIFLIVNIVLLVVSILFRFYFYEHKLILHYHTLSVIGSFCIGNLLAYTLFFYKEFIVKKLTKNFINFIYFSFFALVCFYPFIVEYEWFISFEKLIVGVFFSIILLDQAIFNKFFIQLKNANQVNYLGKISYGLYCYHGLTIGLLLNVFSFFKPRNSTVFDFIIFPIVSLLLTLLIAHFSFKYFELYFLKFKKKFYQTGGNKNEI
jgi:peptidoglycan/LPS O-acetylase OafA/YrhL